MEQGAARIAGEGVESGPPRRPKSRWGVRGASADAGSSSASGPGVPPGGCRFADRPGAEGPISEARASASLYCLAPGWAPRRALCPPNIPSFQEVLLPQALSNVLGFPRIGPQRELKSATEAYWSGDRSLEDLAATARELRAANWKLQRDAGIDLIPSNDFSLYDQVLDTVAMVGAVPERYGWDGSSDVDLDTYFAMARGRKTGGVDVTAMEMTKWFDTNYHYIVPELERGMKFRFASRKPLEQYAGGGGAGHRDEAGAGRPAHLPAAGQVRGRGVRPAGAARRPRRRCTPRCSPSSASSAPSGCSSTSPCWSRTALRRSSRRSSAHTRGSPRSRARPGS